MALMGDRPRIGIAGISIESSKFSPHRAGLADFTVTRDADLRARYEWLTQLAPWAAGADWVPLLHARSLPGGAVESAVYAPLKDEILRRAAAAGALGGLIFAIHGAMSVVGMTDGAADTASAVRA